jgi:hypothetical protein
VPQLTRPPQVPFARGRRRRGSYRDARGRRRCGGRGWRRRRRHHLPYGRNGSKRHRRRTAPTTSQQPRSTRCGWRDHPVHASPPHRRMQAQRWRLPWGEPQPSGRPRCVCGSRARATPGTG